MPDVLDRKEARESRPRREQVEAGASVKEKVREPVREVPVVPTRSRFVRWLGWMVALVVVAGTAGLVWWAMSTPASELTDLEIWHREEVSRFVELQAAQEASQLTELEQWHRSQLDADAAMAEASFNSQTRALLDSMTSRSAAEAALNGQTRALHDSMTSRSAAEAQYNEETRQLLEWNSYTLDPISRTTRQLLEQNS